MIKEAIVKIVDKQDLTYDEAYTIMNEIMNGETSPTQNAAFLAALSTKSTKAETIDEISGCAAAMRDHALKVEHDMDVLEIVGTGGDNAHSFNISTTSALVEAHSEEEIEIALRAGARIIGVNNRNLSGFSVDIHNAEKLRALVPKDVLFVAESGIRTPEDIAVLKKAHVNAVLIGETLMKAPDKKAMLRTLRGDAS